VPTDQFDVLISQRVGLIAEQLAAPRNRDRFWPVIPRSTKSMEVPQEGRFITIRVVLGVRAPTRRLGVGASMSVERG